MAALTGLAACGSSGDAATTPAAPNTTAGNAPATAQAVSDPCALLHDSEVAGLESGLGPGKVQTVAGSQVCEWPNAKGITAVMLLVAPAPAGGPRAALQNALAPTGYTISDVSGIGDSAAVAVQQADPNLGTAEAVAEIIAQTGDRIVEISTPQVLFTTQSPKFATLKQLTSTALDRLPK